MGVFATRSPFRPNPIGLSSVKLIEVKEEAGLGTVLYVEGADMLDGTPIYDIKPYIAYSDSHPDAKSSFAEKEFGKKLTAEIPENLSSMLSEDEKRELCVLLEEDPRPSYQKDSEREYGMFFGKHEIFFKVSGDLLSVTGIK